MGNPLFTFAGMEWVWVVLVIILLIFGARKLPELARALGRAGGEFKKGKTEAEVEAKKMEEEFEKGKEEGISGGRPERPEVVSEAKLEREEVAAEAKMDRVRLIKTAKELGISTEGKTDEEIREEIWKTLKR